jgi:hypothetical protein
MMCLHFLWTGMTVRCCRTYEEVHEGDLGRVTKLDRDGLHDLNVQVAWGARSAGTYWVRYIHVELMSQPPGAVSAGGNLSPIKAVLLFHFNIFWGIFYFYVLYPTLLHLPPLRFHCADGCWDRTQDRCNWCIGSQTL